MAALDYSKIADLYDSYVRFQADVPFFLEELAGEEGPVLELTAGTGRVSLPLIEAGVDLTCVDSSVAMLAVLREKLLSRGLRASLLAADMIRLSLQPRFAAAFIPFHAFHEILRVKEQIAALRGVAAALIPGGRLVCTLHNPPVRLQSVGSGRQEVGRFPLDGGRGEVAIAADLSFDRQQRIVHGFQFLKVFDAAGAEVERHELPIHFSLTGLPEFHVVSATAGFEIQRLYGNYDRSDLDLKTSPYIIVCGRKRDDPWL